MSFTTFFYKLDEALFPYLNKSSMKFLTLITPFTVEGFNAELGEFNKHIGNFNKINSEIQSILQYNNKILAGEVPLTNGVTGSWEVDKSLPELGKEILSDPAGWLFSVIKGTFVLVWNNLFPVLKWLCLIVAIAGILYMLFSDGYGKKYTAGAVIVYFILSILNALIN
jgi:hypothetical protein